MRTYKVHRRLYSALLTAALAVSLAAGAGSRPAYATTAEEIRDQARDDLEETNQRIEQIEGNQESVANDLKQAAADMNALVAKMEQLNSDIADKQAEVEEAADQLVAAKKVEAEQYEAMKLRIQYMYENSVDTSIWTAILESDGISEMLNRLEYANDLYQSDRDMMASYQAAVQVVEDWSRQLALEMEELMALQDTYEDQRDEMKILIAALQQKKAQYAEELAGAQAAADEYQDTIDEQERIIREQEAAAAAQNPDSYEGGGSGEGGLGDAAYLEDPSYDPAFTSGVSGDELVSYAMQFVGNPYRWGGNSLTNGCDCSGFVHLVYAHFGISTPRYSQSFKTVGEPVAYENIKAGDVVVYPGHVAIYIGNGCIVEAQSTHAGITCNRSVNCHTITAIRRLL
ncbi:MAG: NlpC/P60 family protein [Blautia sp.]|nr:NlpC/P60 family protein [Blautia sp.]